MAYDIQPLDVSPERSLKLANSTSDPNSKSLSIARFSSTYA